MKRRWITAIAALLLLSMIAITGCGQKPGLSAPEDKDTPTITNSNKESGEAATAEGSTSQGDTDNQKAAEAEIVRLDIQVYLTDSDLMELFPVSKQITYSDEAQKYEEAFKALQTSDEERISLWDKVILNSAEYSNGQVNIDITLPDEARLGAGGEAFAIDSLKQTMFQFEEVQQIELTVDGQQLDTLMGHVDLEHPIKK